MLPDEEDAEPSTREEYWRLAGGYRHVNRRLRELLAEPARRRLFAPRDLPSTRETAKTSPPPAAGLAAWRPDPAGDGSPTARPTQHSRACAARARAR